jgi:hypothetical protein
MIVSVLLTARLSVDTAARTAHIVWTVPAAEGEGDVEVARQDVTSRLTAADRRRLRHLLDPPADRP